MKYLLIAIILCSVIGCSSLKGPMGPAGQDGLDGKDGQANIFVYEKAGTLGYPTTSTVSVNTWDFVMPEPIYSDSTIVQVWCRTNSTQMWWEPVWYYDQLGAVRITSYLNNAGIGAVQGNQYKIQVMYKNDN